MDKPKKEQWYQLWWVKFILTIISAVVGGVILTYVLEPEKTKKALTNFFSPLQSTWTYIVNLFSINISLGSLLIIISSLGLLWVIWFFLKKSSFYREIFLTDKQLKLMDEKFEQAAKEYKEHMTDYKSLINQHEDLMGKFKELLKLFENSTEELTQAKNDVSEKNKQYKIIEDELEQTNNKLKKAEEERKKLSEQLLVKQMFGLKLKQGMEDLESKRSIQITHLQNVLNLTEKHLGEVNEELKATKTELNELKNKHEAVCKAFEDSNEHLFAARNIYKANQKKITELNNQLTQTNLDHEKTKKKLEHMEVELTHTNYELEEANKKILLHNEEKKEPEAPLFTAYKRDKFFKWIWEWEWKFDTSDEKWEIINLQALCPTCDIELMNDSGGGLYAPYQLAKCPKCKKTFGYAGNKDAEDINAVTIIIMNKVKRGTFLTKD